MTIEKADGERGIGTFPAHWGSPEGRSNSTEREAWVARSLATEARTITMKRPRKSL